MSLWTNIGFVVGDADVSEDRCVLITVEYRSLLF